MTRQAIVDIDVRTVRSWSDFHALFSRTLGFPDFYGGNMDAWIDCMTSLDEPEDGLSEIHAPASGMLTLNIENAHELKANSPDIWVALNECAAFVNWRRMETGMSPVLALSYRV